jgi:quinol-cytochrome oxidoreductase complex cytochrome b subunit
MSSPPPIQIVESTDPLATPRRVAMVRSNIRPAVRQQEERWVMTFPHLIVREVILFQIVLIVLGLAAIFFDAPLQGIANPLETPNPAKAPWYFLGLQELLHYFPPIVAGVLMPALVVIALVVIPYARVNLSARPIWQSDQRRTAIGVGVVTAILTAIFAIFACWPIAVPTLAVGLAIFAARGGEVGGRLRQRLALVTLPEWIMTWFVVIATILTVIGTFFRGPGWSLVWPGDAAVFG